MGRKMDMKKQSAWILILLFLGGCNFYEPSVPEGYDGPLATLKDTAKMYSYAKADAFYLTSVDGREVENSRLRLENAHYDVAPDKILVKRDIPATELTLGIEGRTLYSAPIMTLMSTVHRVAGTVDFVPEAGKTYAVKGQLGDNYAAVWIEDAATHDIVTERVEIRGPNSLGFFEK